MSVFLQRMGLLSAGGAPAASVFPSVIGVGVTSTGTTNTTTHAVVVPAPTSGDGILVRLQTTGSTDPVPTNPTGFGAPVWVDLAGGNNTIWYMWFKVSDGTETNFNITTANSRASSTLCMVVRNFTGVPVVATPVYVSTTSPNPPNLVTGFGAVKTLFIAGAGASTNSGQYFNGTGYPSGYNDNQTYWVNGANGIHGAIATKEVEAASEDPPTYTGWTFNRMRNGITFAIQGT